MALVAKRLFFDIPGLGRVNALPGGSIKLSGMKREGVAADTGPVGYTEEPGFGELSFKLPNKGISIAQLKDLKDIAVTAQDDAGVVYQCQEAFVTEPPTLSGGEIDVKMMYAREEEVR
jgi:hypothetical protein